MYVAKQFLKPVNLEQYPNYASIVKYPMDLSTIQARLESHFYRQVSAVENDVSHIYINAFEYNLPTSDIVRNASVVSDLCLEIIRNKDSSEVKALYQQVLEKYRIQDEKEEDEPKPKKTKPTTLATTSDPCWKQQCNDPLELSKQQCKDPLEISKQHCKDPLELSKQPEDSVLFIDLANNITRHSNKEQILELKADIQKDIHVLLEQLEQINGNCSTLFEKLNKFNQLLE
ncbi:hypothetical protein OUZ56_030441 [Daphnia magna]|uniref:Bromo domain-containing protein n=1 Tax=Daphnia magna TaxID=35525 RepID=A0ABQ9ZRB6_9CRUS|nr:hypothetical protein OUZ56_030441 [Daphnia magna]